MGSRLAKAFSQSKDPCALSDSSGAGRRSHENVQEDSLQFYPVRDAPSVVKS